LARLFVFSGLAGTSEQPFVIAFTVNNFILGIHAGTALNPVEDSWGHR
jgi:hypothetical protein